MFSRQVFVGSRGNSNNLLYRKRDEKGGERDYSSLLFTLFDFFFSPFFFLIAYFFFSYLYRMYMYVDYFQSFLLFFFM